jgi:predicted RNA-binding Zn-ribbon protein involved in translation (DUF1610 family)
MKYFRIILTAITVILCAAAGWALYSVSGERLLGMDSQLGYYMAKYYRYAAAAAALFLLITVIVWTAFFSYRRKHPQPAKMKKSRKIKPAAASANTKITPKEKTAPVKCPNCGAAVNPGQHFCTQCGFRF